MLSLKVKEQARAQHARSSQKYIVILPSRKVLASLFSEAGVIHVNWISCGHCITSRGHICQIVIFHVWTIVVNRSVPMVSLLLLLFRVQCSESSSSITSSSDMKIAALKAEISKINKNLMRVLQVNQKVKAVTPNCETCGDPHSFSDCPATIGQTRNVYAAGAYQ
nr:hypothetical protein [Tanacetum cinerariifolium]